MNEDREISNFEKLASKTKEQLMTGREKSMEWLHLAVDASADQLEKAGDFTKEEGERAGRFLKRSCCLFVELMVRAHAPNIEIKKQKVKRSPSLLCWGCLFMMFSSLIQFSPHMEFGA